MATKQQHGSAWNNWVRAERVLGSCFAGMRRCPKLGTAAMTFHLTGCSTAWQAQHAQPAQVPAQLPRCTPANTTHLAAQRGVPVVFYRVVGAPLEVRCHARPLRQAGRQAGVQRGQCMAWHAQCEPAQRRQLHHRHPPSRPCHSLLPFCDITNTPGTLPCPRALPCPRPRTPHLVAVAAVEAHNDLILLPRPLPPLDVGVQVVVPSAGGQGRKR